MKAVYCENWYWFKNIPNGEMTEAQAFAKFNTPGDRFSVALFASDAPAGDAVPTITVATMAGGDGMESERYLPSGTSQIAAGFELIDGRPFMFSLDCYHYPDELHAAANLLTYAGNAEPIDTYVFKPDGSATVRRQVGVDYRNYALYEIDKPVSDEFTSRPPLKFGKWEIMAPPTVGELETQVGPWGRIIQQGECWGEPALPAE